MEEKRLRIGELLIEAGVLNHGKLREALDLQKQEPRPLGVILVESGFVTEAQLIATGFNQAKPAATPYVTENYKCWCGQVFTLKASEIRCPRCWAQMQVKNVGKISKLDKFVRITPDIRKLV